MARAAQRAAPKGSRKRAKKVAVVTGGGTGIGRDCANKLARDGFVVAVIGRRANRLKPKRGERFHPYPCDISDAAQVKTTIRAILADLGRIDVLVNNAGILIREPLAELTRETIETTIGINLIGTMNLCLACLSALKKTKGSIINMSSGLAQRPSPGVSIYSATKGGIESFTKALAIELAPHRVRANVVAPGLVRSEIYTSQGMDKRSYDKMLLARGAEVYPLGRAGEPEDVSEMVAYLASDKANWMTGVIIPIDGGRCAA